MNGNQCKVILSDKKKSVCVYARVCVCEWNEWKRLTFVNFQVNWPRRHKGHWDPVKYLLNDTLKCTNENQRGVTLMLPLILLTPSGCRYIPLVSRENFLELSEGPPKISTAWKWRVPDCCNSNSETDYPSVVRAIFSDVVNKTVKVAPICCSFFPSYYSCFYCTPCLFSLLNNTKPLCCALRWDGSHVIENPFHLLDLVLYIFTVTSSLSLQV